MIPVEDIFECSVIRRRRFKILEGPCYVKKTGLYAQNKLTKVREFREEAVALLQPLTLCASLKKKKKKHKQLKSILSGLILDFVTSFQ